MCGFKRPQSKFFGRASFCSLVLLLSGLGGLKPSSAMMRTSEGSLAKSVDLPGAGAASSIVLPEEKYQSKKFTYAIVSQGNCKTSTLGSLSGCVFPEITLNEGSRRFPPLPFETKVKVVVSPSCGTKIEPAFASSNIRLGHVASIDDENHFYRNETLSFNQSQIRVLRHSELLPFTSLSLAPKVDEIFKNATFPADCEITLEIEPNRIAVRTIAEAAEHIKKVGSQMELMSRLTDALVALRECRPKGDEKVSTLGGLWQKITQAQTRATTCRVQAAGLQKLTEAFELELSKNAVLSGDPAIRKFTKSIQAFSKVLNQNTTSLELKPEKMEALVSRLESDAQSSHDSRITALLDPEYLRNVGLELVNQQKQIELARESLVTLFQDQFYPRALEDLEDILFEEISGAQGTLDSVIYGIRQIAPFTEPSLPSE